MKFSLTEVSWRADEELKLLHALGKVGIGNWDVVATQVYTSALCPTALFPSLTKWWICSLSACLSSQRASCASQVGGKSAEECERHYIQSYLQSKTAPIPDMSWAQSAENASGAGPADEYGLLPISNMISHSVGCPDPTEALTRAVHTASRCSVATSGVVSSAHAAPARDSHHSGDSYDGQQTGNCRKKGGGKAIPQIRRDSKGGKVADDDEKFPPVALPFAYAGFYPNRGDFEQVRLALAAFSHTDAHETSGATSPACSPHQRPPYTPTHAPLLPR
jgi:hypothetical protein